MKDFYDKLVIIFKENTTLNWKNGWHNEGNREDTSLDVVNHINGYNSFLVEKNKEYNWIKVCGPDGFEIEVDAYKNHSLIRVDIKNSSTTRYHSYFYVSLDNWCGCETYLIDICKKMYDVNIQIRECITDKEIHGSIDPPFLKEYNRDIKLDRLGIN